MRRADAEVAEDGATGDEWWCGYGSGERFLAAAGKLGMTASVLGLVITS
jgi:hypothetical protein